MMTSIIKYPMASCSPYIEVDSNNRRRPAGSAYTPRRFHNTNSNAIPSKMEPSAANANFPGVDSTQEENKYMTQVVSCQHKAIGNLEHSHLSFANFRYNASYEQSLPHTVPWRLG
ncbi:hypothetical protein ACHAXH_003028 [Discostella pseudostelligera]